MPDHDSYRVKLEVFEGPLDLLLYLIRKAEVDIYDIPIAMIVEQYMACLGLMRELNLDVAGDFLVMAATLSHIKSQMLLPPDTVEGDDPGEEGVDPRAELVRKLLDYQKFKEAAEELVSRPVLGRDVFVREVDPEQVQEAAQIAGVPQVTFAEVGVFELLSALQDVLDRAEGKGFHEVSIERISIADRINQLLDLLRDVESITFDQLFSDAGDRAMVITTFLAMLELIRLKVVRASQERPFGPITMLRAVAVDDRWMSENLPRIERV